MLINEGTVFVFRFFFRRSFLRGAVMIVIRVSALEGFWIYLKELKFKNKQVLFRILKSRTNKLMDG